MSVGPIEGPGYVTGTWAIDPAHSDVGFAVRHLMISNVKGHFTRFGGRIVAAEDPLKPEVTATIDMTAVDTANAMRDEHLRAADFFEVEKHPTMSYRSTGIRPDGDIFVMEGELTLKGVTRPVPLTLEVNGFSADPGAPARPPGSPPAARSTGWASASATTDPSPAYCSGRRSGSSWRSRPSRSQRAR